MPQFIAPQLCKRVSRPPVGADWVHEIKLDGYRMQLRVAAGQTVMRTRKGLDWTSDFAAIAEAGHSWMTASSMVKWSRSIIMARRISRHCRPLCPRKVQGLTYFAFDLLYAAGENLGTSPSRIARRV